MMITFNFYLEKRGKQRIKKGRDKHNNRQHGIHCYESLQYNENTVSMDKIKIRSVFFYDFDDSLYTPRI